MTFPEKASLATQSKAATVYRALRPIIAEYSFFSSAHGSFTKLGPKLTHKSCLKKLKRLNSYRVYSLTTTQVN